MQALPQWDLLCAALAAAAAFVWVKLFDGLASTGVLDQKLSRKLVHSSAGPLFLLTWPFFSDMPHARFCAALVPCLNGARLLAVGSGLVADPGLVASVSRAGDRRELLKGPLYYVVVLVGLTLAFWRTNPAAAVAVSLMCGGDGLADIAGRRWGGSPAARLPWNPAKSWPGSAAMFGGGLAMAAALAGHFCSLGFYPCPADPAAAAACLAAVCAAATLVESAPLAAWGLDDNLSVPAVAVAGTLALLPLAAGAS